MQYVVKQEKETLDEIVYKKYGSSFSYLELVLNTNVFLYTEEVYLTPGIVIELPDIRKEAQSRIKLWN